MKKIISLPVMMFMLSLCAHSYAQTNSNEWTKHQAKKWFHKKEWLGGLQLKPHKSIDAQVFARQYQLNKKYWDEAFAFMKNHDLKTLAKGKYSIDGDNVFASVTEDPTKDFDKTNWESHRKYIDLQYVIAGKEKIGVCPITKAIVTKPYNESRDAANYSATGKIYKATPETFFIFFPGDAHRPNIADGNKEVDKKLVIKVKYAE